MEGRCWETLTRRGALVEYAEVYQRNCPEPTGDLDKKPWLDSLDVITATSNAILDNLRTCCLERRSVSACNRRLW